MNTYRKDILMTLVDQRFDLSIAKGDFEIGISDLQHVAHILEAEQGQYRQVPLVGAGVLKMINGTISGEEKRKIKLQLAGDGYQVDEIIFDEKILKIRI